MPTSPTWTTASTRRTTFGPGSGAPSSGFLRAELGEDWWRTPEVGTFLRALFAEGTRPSSEEIAGRIGFEPLDTGPLVEEALPLT